MRSCQWLLLVRYDHVGVGAVRTCIVINVYTFLVSNIADCLREESSNKGQREIQISHRVCRMNVL